MVNMSTSLDMHYGKRRCDGVSLCVLMSSSKIVEDAEYGLWTVTLFRKKADEFKANARDRK